MNIPKKLRFYVFNKFFACYVVAFCCRGAMGDFCFEALSASETIKS